MITLLVSFALAGDVLDDGHAVRAVKAAVPFTLTTPYAYDWSAERAEVKAGTILVLDVDPAWLEPSNVRQAVLYVGALPAEKLNTGYPEGRLVVIVPSSVNVATAPIYFGGYELPERVDTAAGAATLTTALARGIKPLVVPASLAAVTLADHGALATYAIALK